MIRLFERENHIHKVFAQLYYVSKPGARGKCDHRFGWMDADLPYLLKFVNQVIEKPNRVRAFAIQKIAQHLIVAGMYLISVYKLLIT